MATKATGWKATCSASVVSSTDTTATIRVYGYWQNDGWTYDINNVSAWVYCNGESYKVKNAGSINATSSTTQRISCGYHDFTISKGTAAKSISCYAKITSNSSYVSGTKSSSSVAVSVSAKTSYVITFNANGGSGAPSSQTKWYGTALTLSTTKPTRTGYSFKNWNTASGGTGTTYASGASYTANAKATLYAQWTADTYVVEYDNNGGSGAPSNQTKTYGVDLTLSSTKPTRTNYNFLGWATTNTATTATYAPGASYTTNSAVTLYAVWELAYVPPTITGLTATRCKADGTTDDFGTYVKVQFDWECCQLTGTNNVSSIKIEWKMQTSTTWTNTTTVNASGTSGTVSQVIGAGAISIDYIYNVRVTVADSMNGSTPLLRNVPTAAFIIDFLAGGTGVAIGKAATLPNTFDVYKQTIIRGNEDASATSASGQLIIGDPDGYHIAMDNNEIMAKNDATTPGNITINYDGGNIGLGGSTSKIAVNGNMYFKNGKALFGTNASGEERLMAQLNASDQMVFGYGGYANNEGASYFDGNAVNIRSKGAIAITSPTAGLTARHYGVNKVLWSGGSYMNASQTATLSEAISAQPHGVVLAFSYYSSGAQNYDWNYHFIPKYHISAHGGSGIGFIMSTASFGSIAHKYLYVSDTTIKGYASNETTGTSCDINYYNNKFVLRYVIGV